MLVGTDSHWDSNSVHQGHYICCCQSLPNWGGKCPWKRSEKKEHHCMAAETSFKCKKKDKRKSVRGALSALNKGWWLCRFITSRTFITIWSYWKHSISRRTGRVFSGSFDCWTDCDFYLLVLRYPQRWMEAYFPGMFVCGISCCFSCRPQASAPELSHVSIHGALRSLHACTDNLHQCHVVGKSSPQDLHSVWCVDDNR